MTVVADAFDPTFLISDYGDVEAEVTACRKQAAVFDFSFMSVARVYGPEVLEVIAQLTDRDLGGLNDGRIRYALCRDSGGWLRSDLTIWKENANSFLVMSGLGQEISELAATIDIQSEDVVVYSLQGPGSLLALNGLGDVARLETLPYYGFTRLDIAGAECLVGRLGYTGELGFEIVAPAKDGKRLWQNFTARARPAGFAAADCLRIEAGFVLFANEFRLPVTAVEAGLGAFAGNDPVPPRHRLVCFCAESHPSPELSHPPKSLAAPEPGTITVTSSCYSAAAGGILGLGYVPFEEAEVNRTFIDPGGRFKNVRTVTMPFYDTAKRRPRAAWS
jgi:aminomethyltransferase